LEKAMKKFVSGGWRKTLFFFQVWNSKQAVIQVLAIN